MIRTCLNLVEQLVSNNQVAGIFVDINISDTEKDDTGVELACAIKNEHAELPVFSITSKFTTDFDKDTFSDATTRGLNGVFLKEYLLGKEFDAARLDRLSNSEFEFMANRRAKVDVCVIVVTQVELEMMDKLFDFIKTAPFKIFDGIRIWKVKIRNDNDEVIEVAITMVGSPGNVLSGIFTSSILEKIKPDMVILAGIAAGVKERVTIYSTVVANSIVYYELQKFYENGTIKYRLKHESLPTAIDREISYLLLQKDNWVKSLSENIKLIDINYDDFKDRNWIQADWINRVNLIPGIIGSGEKLISNSDFIEELDSIIIANKGLFAIEMEAFGFINACKDKMVKKYFIIRGISDFGGDEKNDPINDNYQKIAALSMVTLLDIYFKKMYKKEKRDF